MTSKEAFERIKDFLGSNYCYELRDEIKIVDDAIDRLEDYDIIFNTPIKSLRKDLEILEILKYIIEVVPNTKYTSGPKYYIKLRQDVILDDETQNKIKEWLDGKDNL